MCVALSLDAMSVRSEEGRQPVPFPQLISSSMLGDLIESFSLLQVILLWIFIKFNLPKPVSPVLNGGGGVLL